MITMKAFGGVLILMVNGKSPEAGQFELYKTSHHFDGIAASPEWLG